ncbi:MAG: 50S ribosomal protein L24 [Myxococcales bacterium]|nr:50S ribosomal protein L24 [Myxococcota bacterium]MDW8282179.1 50S ribosomal protein L24 [Myxococcales bacterium]
MQRIRKDDIVEIIAGKDKGKRGRVLRILHKKNRVVVERLMMVKRHTKPTPKNPQGGILDKEGTIHISNVMPIDPGTERPTRVRTLVKPEGRYRIGKSGAIIEARK